MNRPFPWEAVYPQGLDWGTPLTTGTLPGLLDHAVAHYAERTAIAFRGRDITFAALGEAVDRLAAALLAGGLATGDRVALYLPNTPWHPVALFAVAKAGLIAVHLSPLDAARMLAYKVGDAGARTLITTDIAALMPTVATLLGEGMLDRVLVGSDARWGDPGPARASPSDDPRVLSADAVIETATVPATWPAVTPDDLALIQYTGGTTGRPKGAMLSHGNLTCAVAQYNAWLDGWGAAVPGINRVLCALPLFHIYALTTILLRHLSLGNVISLHQRFDAEAVLHDIEANRVHSFPGVPTMWIALANFPGVDKRDFSSLVHAASGGAPLPIEVGRRLEALTGLTLRGGWGMTETAPAGTNLPLKGPIKEGSIGIPLPGVELDIVSLDDPTRVLPPGEVGELRVRGPNVTRGYWNRPEESTRAFVGDRFLTGDVGYRDEEGWFFIVERKSDMIISGGFNVYPQVIEQAIYEHPAVAETVVIGIPDAYRGEAAKAFVVLKEGAAPFDLDGLKAFLADKVGRHEMPAALEIRASLPRTPVGKLSRAALREAADTPSSRTGASP